MPVYEYYCDNCRREVTVTLPIREHDKGVPAWPPCGSRGLQKADSPRAVDLPPLRGAGAPAI